MDYVSIAQVSHRRSVDARMPNGQPLGHPMFSRPTSPPSLTNRRSTPIMRPSNGSFSASQYAKSNLKGRDAPIAPAIYSSGSPNDMRITSSSYGSTSFQTYHPHLPTQRPADSHTGSAPPSLPIDVSHPSSHRMPAASGYSERRINDLGNNNSDGDSDDSSCVLFETTINGDYCIRSDAFPRYGHLSNPGSTSETKISLNPSTRTPGAENQTDDDECDADIFDSFIPAQGRPAAAPPAIAGGASHLRPVTPPSLQTFGIAEPVFNAVGSRSMSVSLSANTSSSGDTLSTPDSQMFQHYAGDSPVIVAASPNSESMYAFGKATHTQHTGIGTGPMGVPWRPHQQQQQQQQHQSHQPRRYVANGQMGGGDHNKPLRSASLPIVATAQQQQQPHHQQQQPGVTGEAYTMPVLPPRNMTAPAPLPPPPEASQQQQQMQILHHHPSQDKLWNNVNAPLQQHTHPHAWAAPNTSGAGTSGGTGIGTGGSGTTGDHLSRYTGAYVPYA